MQVMRGDAELMTDGKEAVSSSIIRQLLLEGHVELMPQCLTRLYQLSGKVMPGEHIGHSLGFPTANLELPCSDKLIPAPGVYAVWAMLEKDRQQRAAMMNIGTRPTFEGKGQTLEVNIFDFDGDLYGQEVDIAFVARLREERRFDSPEALVAQLDEECIDLYGGVCCDTGTCQYGGSGCLAVGDGQGYANECHWDDYHDGCFQCDHDCCVPDGEMERGFARLDADAPLVRAVLVCTGCTGRPYPFYMASGADACSA